MLHSLFSIDYFVNLLRNAHDLTKDGGVRPIYNRLLRAAINFRGADTVIFQNEVDRFWQLLTQTDPGGVGFDERNYPGTRRFNAGGAQHDATDLFDQLMHRLCSWEIPLHERR